MYFAPDTIEKIRKSDALDRLLTTTTTAKHGHKGRYVCPRCGANDAATFWSRQGVRMVKCFSCGFAGDIVELYAYHLHSGDDKPSRTAALQAVLADFADKVDTLKKPTHGDSDGAAQQPRRDFSEYCRTCSKTLTADSPGWNYLRSRGFADHDIEFLRSEYQIGFDFQCTGHGSLTNAQPCIIIPTGRAYKARSIDNNGVRYVVPKGGTAEFFGIDSLYAKNFLFVLEGEFDGLAVLTSARYCRHRGKIGVIALGGAGNAGKLANQQLNQQLIKSTTVFTLLDGDNAGFNATQEFTRQITDDIKVYGVDSIRLLKSYRRPDGNPVKDIAELFQIHGKRVLAGLLDALIEHPTVFFTVE